MDLRSKIIKASPEVEKVMIGLLLLNAVLAYLIFKEDSYTPYLLKSLLLLQVVLLSFYLYLSGQDMITPILFLILVGVLGMIF